MSNCGQSAGPSCDPFVLYLESLPVPLDKGSEDSEDGIGQLTLHFRPRDIIFWKTFSLEKSTFKFPDRRIEAVKTHFYRVSFNLKRIHSQIPARRPVCNSVYCLISNSGHLADGICGNFTLSRG